MVNFFTTIDLKDERGEKKKNVDLRVKMYILNEYEEFFLREFTLHKDQVVKKNES
jgi:hypothetical protein